MLSAECHHQILIQVSESPVPMRPSCASATVLAIFEMETFLMCFLKERIVEKEESSANTDVRQGSQMLFDFFLRTMKEVVGKESRN